MNIHPTAVISELATLGFRVAVGPYSIIEPDTTIGDRCDLHGHVTIKRFSTLGPHNRIYEGAVIGGEPQDLSFTGDDSALTIGARNRIREAVTINRGAGRGSETSIGSDCFIMTGAHVAHDCRLATESSSQITSRWPAMSKSRTAPSCQEESWSTSSAVSAFLR